MLVESVHAINAPMQDNPHITQVAETQTGKSDAGILFEEFLRANLQQISKPAITSQTENHIAGLLLGYFVQPKIASKSEQKLEDNAS